MHGAAGLTSYFLFWRGTQMVHKRRIMDPSANTPEVQEFLEGLRKRRAFYYTPIGSNDDWCVGSSVHGDCFTAVSRLRCRGSWWVCV